MPQIVHLFEDSAQERITALLRERGLPDPPDVPVVGFLMTRLAHLIGQLCAVGEHMPASTRVLEYIDVVLTMYQDMVSKTLVVDDDE